MRQAHSQHEAQHDEQERQALSARNHHLRRGMTLALRRALKQARLEIRNLPAAVYDPLFASWDHLLTQAGTDADALERLFTVEFAEPHWEATNPYSPNPDEDAQALADVCGNG
jgi:hypothetical protein